MTEKNEGTPIPESGDSTNEIVRGPDIVIENELGETQGDLYRVVFADRWGRTHYSKPMFQQETKVWVLYGNEAFPELNYRAVKDENPQEKGRYSTRDGRAL